MTLNGVMAFILCCFTEFGSFRGAQVVEEWCRHKKSSRLLAISSPDEFLVLFVVPRLRQMISHCAYRKTADVNTLWNNHSVEVHLIFLHLASLSFRTISTVRYVCIAIISRCDVHPLSLQSDTFHNNRLIFVRCCVIATQNIDKMSCTFY